MFELARILAGAAAIWAAVALVRQVRTARGGGRPDHSRAAGSRRAGVLHAVIAAMRPRHKESARFHPREFALGLVLHAGLLRAFADVGLLIVAPRAVDR